MQHLKFSPGTALCRFCGQQVDTNRLSVHIATYHRVPTSKNLRPRLVTKSPAAVVRTSAKKST